MAELEGMTTEGLLDAAKKAHEAWLDAANAAREKDPEALRRPEWGEQHPDYRRYKEAIRLYVEQAYFAEDRTIPEALDYLGASLDRDYASFDEQEITDEIIRRLKVLLG